MYVDAEHFKGFSGYNHSSDPKARFSLASLTAAFSRKTNTELSDTKIVIFLELIFIHFCPSVGM
jgi:hypothetical protein